MLTRPVEGSHDRDHRRERDRLPITQHVTQMSLLDPRTLGEPDGVASLLAHRIGDLTGKHVLKERRRGDRLHARVSRRGRAPCGFG